MASTAADLKAELKKLGVDVPAKAKKADLEKLLADAKASAPTGSSSDAPADAAAPGGEGPTSLPEDVPTEAPAPTGEVLLKPLMRQAGILPAGSPVPEDLTAADIERLQRKGVIGGGVEGPSGPRFDVFSGEDGQWYWRLVAANGEIVADGEGYDTERGAERGVDAVIEAAAVAALERG